MRRIVIAAILLFFSAATGARAGESFLLSEAEARMLNPEARARYETGVRLQNHVALDQALAEFRNAASLAENHIPIRFLVAQLALKRAAVHLGAEADANYEAAERAMREALEVEGISDDQRERAADILAQAEAGRARRPQRDSSLVEAGAKFIEEYSKERAEMPSALDGIGERQAALRAKREQELREAAERAAWQRRYSPRYGYYDDYGYYDRNGRYYYDPRTGRRYNRYDYDYDYRRYDPYSYDPYYGPQMYDPYSGSYGYQYHYSYRGTVGIPFSWRDWRDWTHSVTGSTQGWNIEVTNVW